MLKVQALEPTLPALRELHLCGNGINRLPPKDGEALTGGFNTLEVGSCSVQHLSLTWHL